MRQAANCALVAALAWSWGCAPADDAGLNEWAALELEAAYSAAAIEDPTEAWSQFRPRFFELAQSGSAEAQLWILERSALPQEPADVEERLGWFERCLRAPATRARALEVVDSFWGKPEFRPRLLGLFGRLIDASDRRARVDLALPLADAMWHHLVEPEDSAAAAELLETVRDDSSDPWLVAEAESMLSALSWQVRGGAAPDLAGEGPDGETVRLHDHRGKIVILEFWGFW